MVPMSSLLSVIIVFLNNSANGVSITLLPSLSRLRFFSSYTALVLYEKIRNCGLRKRSPCTQEVFVGGILPGNIICICLKVERGALCPHASIIYHIHCIRKCSIHATYRVYQVVNIFSLSFCSIVVLFIKGVYFIRAFSFAWLN
jgi:hypothetical protein